MIFNAPKLIMGGIQILFGHQKNGTLPLDLAYLGHLSVIVAT
jgi:hypothetical protein